jgi:hypothetical protein
MVWLKLNSVLIWYGVTHTHTMDRPLFSSYQYSDRI